MNNFIQRLFIICRHLLNNTLLQKAHTYFAKSTLLVLATMLNGFVFASEEADDNEDIPVIEVESDTLIEEEIETWKKKQQDGKKQKKARKAKKEARKAKKKARKKK